MCLDDAVRFAKRRTTKPHVSLRAQAHSRASGGSVRIRRWQTVVLVTLLPVISCESPTRDEPYERWTAELRESGHVLTMHLRIERDVISGTAGVGQLRGTGVETFDVDGTKRADSVFVSFEQFSQESFRFVGVYQTPSMLSGVLTGAEFGTGRGALFRRR